MIVLSVVILASAVLAILAALKTLVNCYVAASTEEETLRKLDKLLAAGFSVTSDPLGEFVRDASQIPAIIDAYLKRIDGLADLQRRYPKRMVSLAIKPSRLGLGLSEKQFISDCVPLLSRTARAGVFVWFDAEKRESQEAALGAVVKLKNMGFGDMGHAVQSVHSSSRTAALRLAANDIPVRVVKGAYKDGDVKSPDAVNSLFMGIYEIADALSHNCRFVAVGTHDEAALSPIVKLSNRLERQYQFLYGIRTRLQEKYLGDGLNVLIYVPDGTFRNAVGYFTRRLREGVQMNTVKMFIRNVWESREFRKKYGL